MSYALIDNATLTGIQRLLGQIETRSQYTPDSDLIALESLVQAILFYNKVVCIDDYKPEFRASRHKQFSFIDHLDPFQLKLDRIQEIADAESQKIQPTIQGGEFVDKDFRAFLDQLKVNIICTWDISSSVYFLTMKMLGQPDSPEFAKYSTVSAAIFEELTDLKRKGDDWNDEV